MLLLAWSNGAEAQTSDDCTSALVAAQKQFDLGLFEDVAPLLAPCLGGGTSRTVALRVHSLLGRAYLFNDEPDKARKEVSALLRLDSTYEDSTSPRFAALISQVRREEQTTQVVSVSKTSESLREAPATVVVITADEIQRRGYLDLEELLHDLQGFDIARMNGAIYSLIYQRGYRSGDNDRLLLIVDGVEQNDLSGGVVSLSRQYPLTNIDRVEVIYGPASTMYGANAYTGVISIVTRAPEGLLLEGKKFGLRGQVAAGDYGMRSVDITAAGTAQNETLAWSLAGNFQQSQARDLSNLPDWDYTYRNHDYRNQLRLPGTPEERAALCSEPSAYIQCSDAGIELTDAGVALVRDLDSGLVTREGLGFDDRAQNWSLYGKLRISNLTLGLQTWQSREGIVSAYGTVLNIAGNTGWTPSNTAFYLKYSLPLDRVKVNLFTRYVQTSVRRESSRFDYMHNYASGILTLWSLIPPCQSPRDPQPVNCAPASPWREEDTFGSLSDQLRSELSVTYEPSDRFSAVTGLEFAKSSLQSQYDSHSVGPGFVFPSASPVHTEHTDVAVYAQGSYRLNRSLRFILAGRMSYNEINDKANVEGFGTLFSPRAGVIYLPTKSVVLKAIYSEAFKDPTDGQKFGTLHFVYDYPSNGLTPEKVRNIELSAGWDPHERLSVQASLYQARYSDVVNLAYPVTPDGTPVENCFFGCLQFQNLDELRVRGLETSARYRTGRFDLWANYTHAQPMQLQPKDLFGAPLLDANGAVVQELPVADIARHQGNIGVDTEWSDRLRSSLRVHYVGSRQTGAGTTYPFTPFLQTDAHSTVDVTVSYHDLLPNTTIQLIGQNLLDANYYDPGNFTLVPRVLQSGRAVSLRLTYGIGRPARARAQARAPE